MAASTPPSLPSKGLKKYTGTKTVAAFKIKYIEATGYGLAYHLYGVDNEMATVPESYIAKHEPKIGGYYVQYEDGYSSFSPAETFEKAYKPSTGSGVFVAPEIFTPEQLRDDPILRYFHFSHLPEKLQDISRPFCELALKIVRETPRNAERSAGLRKLLETKDCIVRAGV